LGLDQGEASASISPRLVSAGLLCPSDFALRATPRHAADSRYVMGSPCGLLTRLSVCCCMPIFVFPAPCGGGLAGGQDAMAHRGRGLGPPALPGNPVILSAVPTFETQRVSPAGSGTTFNARSSDIRSTSRRIEDFVPCGGVAYGEDPCVADSSRPYPASYLPALHLSVRGNACACVPLFFSGIRRPALLPLASFRRTLLYHPPLNVRDRRLAFGYPSPPSGWVWTLPDMRVIISDSII